MEPYTHAGPAELNGESSLALPHASCYIVGLHFLGPTALHPGGFVRHARIGKRAPDYPRPLQLLGIESGRRTNIRLRIETQPDHLKQLAQRAYQRGIQMFL